jgi:hypothetical protein
MNGAAAAISAATAGAPPSLFAMLAPCLDLKTFVELCGGEGGGRIETPLEQRQGDDQGLPAPARFQMFCICGEADEYR